MKSFATLFTLSLLVLATACGGGDNTIEAKQKSLASLKKQALEFNAQIVALEKEIEKAGGASATKAILVATDTIQTETFTHYIELQGKVESESVSYITPRAGGGQVRAVYIQRGDRVKRGQIILQLDNTEKVSFQPNIGLGFKYKGIQVDYALTDLGDQSAALYSNIFSVKVDLSIFR